MPLLRRLRHRHTHHAQQYSHSALPYGVRVLAWSRAIRWIGWGLGEALIPVFIIMFSQTFAEAGLFSSSVDIASLLSLPIIGLWIDKVPARHLILLSLLLYPIVGVSYFMAGVLGLAIFIVIARVVNGVTWEMENVGIDTYYRRTIDQKHIATSFGFIDTWSHVAWISAALVGIVLVHFMPIYYLLLGIAPFSIIAYFVVLWAPVDSPRADARKDIKAEVKKRLSFIHSYLKAATGWRAWTSQFWLLSVLILFSGIVSSLMYFFIPIDAYLTGANLPMVVLITVFGAIPALFGYKLGAIADVRNRYGLISGGLVGVAIIALGLAIFPQYWFKLVAIFLMGIILELFYVAQSSLITTLGPAETYGERGSAFESVVTASDLVAPLILGVGLDLVGFSNIAYIVMAVGCLSDFRMGMLLEYVGEMSLSSLADPERKKAVIIINALKDHNPDAAEKTSTIRTKQALLEKLSYGAGRPVIALNEEYYQYFSKTITAMTIMAASEV